MWCCPCSPCGPHLCNMRGCWVSVWTTALSSSSSIGFSSTGIPAVKAFQHTTSTQRTWESSHSNYCQHSCMFFIVPLSAHLQLFLCKPLLLPWWLFPSQCPSSASQNSSSLGMPTRWSRFGPLTLGRGNPPVPHSWAPYSLPYKSSWANTQPLESTVSLVWLFLSINHKLLLCYTNIQLQNWNCCLAFLLSVCTVFIYCS